MNNTVVTTLVIPASVMLGAPSITRRWLPSAEVPR